MKKNRERSSELGNAIGENQQFVRGPKPPIDPRATPVRLKIVSQGEHAADLTRQRFHAGPSSTVKPDLALTNQAVCYIQGVPEQAGTCPTALVSLRMYIDVYFVFAFSPN